MLLWVDQNRLVYLFILFSILFYRFCWSHI
jgi:hypothetical protein